MNADPDPHGQAALMLCESLILLLVENRTIDKEQVLESIDGVIEVKRALAGTRERVVVSMESIALLRAIGHSVAASGTRGSSSVA